MSKAASTRTMILTKSFELIYKQGYQTTSIDNILTNIKVTKGAFFYHFKNKDEMGLAMINEIVYPGMYDMLVKPLINSQNPVNDIHETMRVCLLKTPFVRAKYGCPLMNLVDEMSPLNEGFKDALLQLTVKWQDAIEESINRGKASKEVREDVNARHVACFVVAGYAGIRSMGKAMGSACYNVYLAGLKNYLKQVGVI